MESLNGSYLPELARLEELQLKLLDSVETECRRRLAHERELSRQCIAGAPIQLQSERRDLVKASRAAAEARADDIRAKAEADAERLMSTLASQRDAIVKEFMEIILPNSGDGVSPGEGQ